MKYTFILYDAIIDDDEIFRIENVYELVNPDISGLKFENKVFENELFSRVEITGQFRIIGDDYQYIIDFLETPFIGHEGFVLDVHQNGVFLGRAYFDPRQNINYEQREIVFKVRFEDHYSKLVQTWNNKYNIAGNQITSQSFDYINQTFIERLDLTFPSQIVTGFLNGGTGDVQYDIPLNGSLFTSLFDPSDPFANWTLEDATYSENSNPNCTTYQFDLTGTATFYRYWRLGSYQGSVATPPPGTPSGTSGWSASPIGNIRVGDTDYPVYIAIITSSFLGGVWRSGTVPCNWRLNDVVVTNNVTLSTTNVVYTDVLKRLDDTIVYLLQKLDARIQIDTSGTSTDSFYGFKNYTGESIHGSNKPFEHISIMGLQNFIPDTSGPSPIQKSNPATRLEVEFKELMDELKAPKFGFYWHIEDRSGTPYFKLIHRSQLSLQNNNPDLRDYKGRDYRVGTRKYEYEDPQYYKLINRQVAGNREFIGTTFENRLFGSGEILEVTSGNYYYDTEDIFENGPVNYDDASNVAFILFACWIDGSTYKVRESTGILNNMLINNGELSWANILDDLLVEIPFTSAYGNDTIITIPSDRQRKRRKVTMNIPIDGIDDFQSTSKITIYYDSGEMDSLIHDANKNVGQLKLRL